MTEHSTIRTIIIDDEAGGRKSLRIILEKYFPEIELIDVCASPEKGMKSIEEKDPDLVFLDIQMPHMSGFDLLKKLSPINFQVIFVSAHDQYAIKAIRFSALDYLLKPVDLDDIKEAISRAKEKMTSEGTAFQYESVLTNLQSKSGYIERIAVPSSEGVDLYYTKDIICCKAEGSYTSVILTGNRAQVISRNLKDFENLLKGSGFCRVHHSCLINMQHVQKYIKGEGGYVTMSEGHLVDISRRKKEDFLKLLYKV